MAIIGHSKYPLIVSNSDYKQPTWIFQVKSLENWNVSEVLEASPFFYWDIIPYCFLMLQTFNSQVL